MKIADQIDRSTRCALAMQRAMAPLNEKWQAQGVPELKMRIGLHHGPVVVGTFGSDKRSDYTAIGPPVNLAARIESVCEPGRVFISGEVGHFLGREGVEDAGSFKLKGIEGPRNLYRLLG